MGYVRVRHTVKLAPGVKLNLNKKSVSLTTGGRGYHTTISSNGTRTRTIGFPGTGISYVARHGPKRPRPSTRADPRSSSTSVAKAHAFPADAYDREPLDADLDRTDAHNAFAARLISGADLVTLSQGAGDVPRSPETIAALERDRPPAWEYRLAAALMLAGAIELEPAYLDFVFGRQAAPAPAIKAAAAADRLLLATDQHAGLLERLEDLFRPERLRVAFGDPDHEADQRQVHAFAADVVAQYDAALALLANLRSFTFPTEFADALAECRILWGSTVLSLRRGIAGTVTSMDRIEADLRVAVAEQRPLALAVRFDFAPDDEAAAALQEALGRIGR